MINSGPWLEIAVSEMEFRDSVLITVCAPRLSPALAGVNEKPTDQLKGIGSWVWRRQGLTNDWEETCHSDKVCFH